MTGYLCGPQHKPQTGAQLRLGSGRILVSLSNRDLARHSQPYKERPDRFASMKADSHLPPYPTHTQAASSCPAQFSGLTEVGRATSCLRVPGTTQRVVSRCWEDVPWLSLRALPSSRATHQFILGQSQAHFTLNSSLWGCV